MGATTPPRPDVSPAEIEQFVERLQEVDEQALGKAKQGPRRSNIHNTAITPDPQGPLCVFSKLRKHTAIDLDTNRRVCQFASSDTAYFSRACVISEEAKWIGAGAISGDVECIGIDDSAELLWRYGCGTQNRRRADAVAYVSGERSVAVLYDNGSVHMVSVQDGVLRKVVNDVATFWPLNGLGLLCRSVSTKQLFVYTDNQCVPLREARVGPAKSVVCACLYENKVIVSWNEGGLSEFDLTNGCETNTLFEQSWFSSMLGSSKHSKILASGTLNGRGNNMPMWVDVTSRVIEVPQVHWPDQCEYASCYPCNRARHCVAENGFIWNTVSNEITEWTTMQ